MCVCVCVCVRVCVFPSDKDREASMSFPLPLCTSLSQTSFLTWTFLFLDDLLLLVCTFLYSLDGCPLNYDSNCVYRLCLVSKWQEQQYTPYRDCETLICFCSPLCSHQLRLLCVFLQTLSFLLSVFHHLFSLCLSPVVNLSALCACV